jgi:hypothetical protein
MASFIHIFSTNKVPWVVLRISWTGTHFGINWNQSATWARHGRTTWSGRPCRCGQSCQVRPALPSAVGPNPWLVPGLEHLLSLEQYLDEHDSLKNVGLIQRWRLGSMGPLDRSLNRHNHHSEVILGIPERMRCITWHRGGPAAPIHLRAGRNRPKEPTYNRLRSSDQGRPRQEVVDNRAGHT